MLTGIESALFLVLGFALLVVNSALRATMLTLSKRYLHRKFAIRRRLGS